MPKAFSKLGRVSMRKLPAKGKITEHGITFERLTNGDGVFSVNVMADGQRIHRVIGRESEGVTRTQAEDFIEKVRTDARAGRLSLPSGRKTSFSFGETAQKYLDRLQETNGKNLVAKERQLRLYLVPFFGSHRLDKISSFMIDQYKRRRLDTNASNGTINLANSPRCRISSIALLNGAG